MKDKKNALRWYCRQIEGKLMCSKQTKKDLLSGFLSELEDQLPTGISKDKLIQRYGTPVSVAAEMQDSISEEDSCLAAKRRKALRIIAVILSVLICIALFVWYVFYRNNTDIVYYNETISSESDVVETQELTWSR